MRILVVVLLLFSSVATSAQDCQAPGGAITGRLARMEMLHPSGETIAAWVLLPYEICINLEFWDEERGTLSPGLVHLVFSEGAEPANLMSLSVDEVVAQGEVVEAHTFWHLGDVVMFNAAIVNAHMAGDTP
jgi:hypothetical protein